jgi:hypothetical protein
VRTGWQAALIGNGSFGALVDPRGRIVWGCLPAFDGDPAFCALLSPRHHEGGDFGIELEDFAHAEQAYIANTAVLRTVLHDTRGGSLELLDFAPRWRRHGRFYRPVSIIRRITPLTGNPRIRVLARPLADWGARVPEHSWGSNHVRWLLPAFTLRLTTDVPVRYIREGLPFVLTHRMHLVLGPDEPLARSIDGYVEEALGRTLDYWREWVRYLAIPLEWQDAVIRSRDHPQAQRQYEDTGAIIAAMTTSIPEAAGSPATGTTATAGCATATSWCNALNRLGATRSMERYLRYIFNSPPTTAACSRSTASTSAARLEEHEVESLSGYRGMGPVRRGNLAWQQKQHDVYGSVPSWPSTQLFFDQRLIRRGDAGTCSAASNCWASMPSPSSTSPTRACGNSAAASEVHTYSAAMCWAACDRLARIASRLGLEDRVAYWRERADRIHATTLARAWRADATARQRVIRRATTWTRQPAVAGRHRIRPQRRPALRGHRRGDRPRTAPRRWRLPLRGPRRLRRTGNASPSAPSGTSTHSPRSGAGTRPARCSNASSRAATGSGCCRRTWPSRMARAMGQLRADLLAWWA